MPRESVLRTIRRDQRRGPRIVSNMAFIGPQGRVERDKLVAISAIPAESPITEPRPDNVIAGNFSRPERDRGERKKIVPISSIVEVDIPVETKPSNVIEFPIKPPEIKQVDLVEEVQKDNAYNPSKRADQYIRDRKNKLVIVRRSGCQCQDPENRDTPKCKSRFCHKKKVTAPVKVIRLKTNKPKRQWIKMNNLRVKTEETKRVVQKSEPTPIRRKKPDTEVA